jgi:lysophospholipase L1-like esterase
MSRQASCSFKVTLNALSLSVTKYEAFGDSLTEGETGRPSVAPTVLDTPNAYPTRLQAAFDTVYPGQATVINRGKSGDTVEMTLATIKSLVRSDRPGAVLLLSGYNNLTGPCGPGDANTLACRAGIDQVGFGIRDCLRAVKEANVGVKFTFVSTLTPPGPTGSERIDANAIIQANTRIRQMTAAEGGILVDSYAAFVGHETEYVNVDGLHLRPAGYQALADGFFAAIQTTIPQTPLFGFTVPR